MLSTLKQENTIPNLWAFGSGEGGYQPSYVFLVSCRALLELLSKVDYFQLQCLDCVML